MVLLQLLQGGPTIMASNVQQKDIRPRRQVQQQQQQQKQQLKAKQRQRHQQHLRLDVATITLSAATTTTTTVALCLSLLLLLILPEYPALAEGNVGCHFVKTLCLDGSEVCYDDNIFGKCIPTTGVDVEDIEKTPLTEDQSRILATMLEEMQGAGLGWDHPFVQCRIQGTLYSLQKHTQLPPNLCANLAPNPEIMDPASAMAFVRFTPPNENFVDELYYAPPKKQHGNMFHQLQQQTQQKQQQRQLRHDPSELAHFSNLETPKQQEESALLMEALLERERERLQREELLRREALLESERDQLAARSRLQLYHMLAGSEPDPEPYQRSAMLPETVAALPAMSAAEMPPRLAPPAYIPADHDDSNEMYFPENYAAFKRTGGNARQRAVQNAEPLPEQRHSSFFRELDATAPRKNVADWKLTNEKSLEQSPNLKLFNPIDYEANEYDEPVEEFEEETADAARALFEKRLVHNSLTPVEEEAILAANTYPANAPKHRMQQLQDGVYTEGGRIFVPERQNQADAYEDADKKEGARLLLENMLGYGFTRHERLDVKKPGPLIGPPQTREDKANRNQTSEHAESAQTKEVLPQHIKDSSQSNKKKKVVKDHSDEDHATHTVDTEYAHVFVKNPIDSWNDGVRIVNELANILHMQGYFTYLTVQPHEVSFRVDSNNPEHKTASDIAKAIKENRGVKNNILRRLGVTVLHAGVGDKIKSDEDGGVSSSRIELAEQGPDVTHIMAYMFAGAGVAAVIVIFITLILINRHDKKRDKLGGLQATTGVAESCSKDYQDLCRARMAGKGNAAEPVTSGRITSLSKDNERPPSSRSSTSSWSEEPALTNMDISTGHMVLSYMEDHLRNKGRLQREWEALCRYEAEPSARDAALQPQCATLNRPGAPLPFDHSRVVLNHLANAEGLDYINASTITDHDPRAPAYVAAQGPLPTTLAHFWQMIWEQGAVVIVALCRLQENGEIACARYWPEEGAEVYHIYEVHLVSEHIWCDDYLVRSFYLKNLRTSETRTVTQFHFLSWPQGGVPAQPKALLDFRRKVNKSYRGRSCPIVVHGSAGAGRTGAYILLDLVLGRMNKGAREIDIAATLEHLRDQRAGVVATRQQFEFVLMAVAEEVHAILKALPANTSGEKRDAEADKKEAVAATGTLKEEGEATNAEAEATSMEATTSSKAKAKQETELAKETETNKLKGTEQKGTKPKEVKPPATAASTSKKK